MAAMHIYRELYGQPRDAYRGEFQPPIAEVREPVRVVHMRRSGNHLLIAINNGGTVSTLNVDKLDSPGLEMLSALDRANAQSALRAIKREVGDAA